MDLASLPVFADADAVALEALAGVLKDEQYREGDVLMRQGDPGDSFALVLDGEVGFWRADGSRRHRLGTGGPGSIVGELAMLTGHVRSATVEAITPVRVAVGDHAAFDVLLSVPGVHDRLADCAARRLAEAATPVHVSLRDGSRLAVRPLLARDRHAIDVALDRADPESLRRRFFSPGKPTGRTVDLLVNINYIDHFAWGVAAENSNEGAATARYIRVVDEPTTAEVAFWVNEPYRGRGLATLLLGALAAAASSAAITRFVANVLNENVDMRAVFDKAGARWQFTEPGVVTASMAVADAAALLDDGLRAQFAATAHDVVTAAGLALVH